MKYPLMVVAVLAIAMLATGCSYPSDTEQAEAAKSSGFNCKVTQTSSWWNNAKGLCSYTSYNGVPCTAVIELSDDGTAVGIERAHCEIGKTEKKG